MIALHQFQTGPEPCEYLSDRQATLEYILAARLSPSEYEARMNQGWRKFGPRLFHPICETCRECRPIRIDADRFIPNRSQRRTLTRSADLTVALAEPTVDDARLALFNRYHAAQTQRKGWPEHGIEADAYIAHFLNNPLPAVEIAVWEGSALRAVALTDVTPHTVSGVYHYHDPDCRERGLGTFVMLHTIALAHRLHKPWAYFGFYVADCPSMSYKSQFRPCEILGTDGLWRIQPSERKPDHDSFI